VGSEMCIRDSANSLRVLNQRTGSLDNWQLYPHQERVLRLAAAHRRLIVLKARQLGLSSVMAYYVLLQAIRTPNLRAAIVADNWENAAGLLEKVRDLAAQLGCPTSTSNRRRITLHNNSTIDCLTVNTSAGTENKTGRSKTYHLLLLSECAYYNNSFAVFASLTSTLVADGQIIIESTATPGPTIFRNIWDSTAPEWHRTFISCEEHPNYRADPQSISEADWESLRDHWGFTDRSAAAWWQSKYSVDFGGDRQRLLREFPVKPEHSWAAASGRWIDKDSTIASCSADGDWEIYHPPAWGGHYIVGVDVAAGVGRDSSAIVVWDLLGRRIAAHWSNANTPADALVAEIVKIHKKYIPHSIYIEKNGLGAALPGYFRETPDLPIVWHNTTEATKYTAMLRVKRAVEGGIIDCSSDFATQVAQVTYELRGERERFRHIGDSVMALSFCLLYEPDYATTITQPPPRRPVPAGAYDLEADLKRAQPPRRSVWRIK
jgi:hypothetical protein